MEKFSKMGNRNEKVTMKERKLEHWKIIAVCLMFYDAVAISFSYFFGLWLRFDFQFMEIPREFLLSYMRFLPWYLVGALVFFWYMRMYRSIWRFAGFNELIRFAAASLIASLVHSVGITLLGTRMPFSYNLVGAIAQLILVVGIRFSYRFYIETLKKSAETDVEHAGAAQKVMIIGAGAAGRSVIKELTQTDKMNALPC